MKMNKIYKHFFVLLLSIFFIACSSNPSQNVATEVCEAFVEGDLEDMEYYMSQEAKLDIAQRRPFLEKFFQSDGYYEMIEDVECEKPSSVRDTEDGRKIFFFGTQFKIKLKEIEGSWKMVR